MRILDIGCGTDLNSEFLIRHAAHLTGLDISLASLRQSGRERRYDRLIEGDAKDTIAAVDTPMDLIIFAGVVYFFRDLDWLFANVARLLAPGGQLVPNRPRPMMPIAMSPVAGAASTAVPRLV